MDIKPIELISYEKYIEDQTCLEILLISFDNGSSYSLSITAIPWEQFEL